MYGGRPNPYLDELALYAALRWSVFPVYPPLLHAGVCACNKTSCEAAGKHPAVADWPTQATSSLEVLTSSGLGLWGELPLGNFVGPLPMNCAFGPYNVGLATGRSSGVFAVDIDPQHDGLESLWVLQEALGGWPRTATSRTGRGGFHYLFRYRPGVKTSAGALSLNGRALPGIDIRSDGGYIVLPPSISVTGRQYEWDVRPGPDDVAEAPSSLIRFLRAQSSPMRQAAMRERHGDVNAGRDSSQRTTAFERAADRYNALHARDWSRFGRRCPACSHRGCFDPMKGMPGWWYCRSSGHPATCGRRGSQGFFGDALDLDAWTQNTTPQRILETQGYL